MPPLESIRIHLVTYVQIYQAHARLDEREELHTILFNGLNFFTNFNSTILRFLPPTIIARHTQQFSFKRFSKRRKTQNTHARTLTELIQKKEKKKTILRRGERTIPYRPLNDDEKTLSLTEKKKTSTTFFCQGSCKVY